MSVEEGRGIKCCVLCVCALQGSHSIKQWPQLVYLFASFLWPLERWVMTLLEIEYWMFVIKDV